MARHTMYQSSVNEKWCVLDLPDDYSDGQPFPPPRTTDRWFDTEDEARQELLQRLDRQETE
ncbi:MAG: hypothetical protein NT151_09315 [Acidobacteria bacterium]|nr:hypothetical protein [Acidobacteriota bacterium]